LLKKIYYENLHLINKFTWSGFTLKYIELNSDQFRELNDANFNKGVFSFVSGPLSTEEGIIILSDIVPKKFVRYVVIHEATKLTWNSDKIAFKAEFKAAKEELSSTDFLKYCIFRLSVYKNSLEAIQEIRKITSVDVYKIITHGHRK
jgi:hypothetical protein